ncbi:MAG: hypothetical protein MUF34_38055, partial [Polyangiaceae bacterium]|nr:hypothetical protein [Polyangiaceae bacterium]
MRSTTKLTLSAATIAAAAALFGFVASRPGASPERDTGREAVGEAVGDAGREAIGDAGTAVAPTPT